MNTFVLYTGFAFFSSVFVKIYAILVTVQTTMSFS